MIGRPEASEAAPYYFTYINQANGNDPIHVIENQLDEALLFFASISEEKSIYRSLRAREMEHSANAKPHHGYGTRFCLSGALVCARVQGTAAQLRSERCRGRSRSR